MMPQLDGETDVIDDEDIDEIAMEGQEGQIMGLKRGFTRKQGGLQNPQEKTEGHVGNLRRGLTRKTGGFSRNSVGINGIK